MISAIIIIIISAIMIIAVIIIHISMSSSFGIHIYCAHLTVCRYQTMS